MHNEQPLQLYQEILHQTHYNSRTKQWTITMIHHSEFGKLRVPNSAREIIDLLPESVLNIKPCNFGKYLKQLILKNIPTKPQ